ncbi:hypothetical protein DPMN_039213, partial [Dreissena polymorpha]
TQLVESFLKTRIGLTESGNWHTIRRDILYDINMVEVISKLNVTWTQATWLPLVSIMGLAFLLTVCSIKIQGPLEAPVGNNVTLTCIAKGGLRFKYTNIKNVQTAIGECTAFYNCNVCALLFITIEMASDQAALSNAGLHTFHAAFCWAKLTACLILNNEAILYRSRLTGTETLAIVTLECSALVDCKETAIIEETFPEAKQPIKSAVKLWLDKKERRKIARKQPRASSSAPVLTVFGPQHPQVKLTLVDAGVETDVTEGNNELSLIKMIIAELM